MKKTYLILLLCLGFLVANAQFSVLHNFNDTDGFYPNGPLVISGKMLYGSTMDGGVNGYGTLFSIDTDGNNHKVLHSFSSNIYGDGGPSAGLVLSGDKLYGMTYGLGINSLGNIFSIDTDGNNYKDIFDFNGTNGSIPYGGLIISGSKLYGMTSQGGADSVGVIFSVDTNGQNYKELLAFDTTDGAGPCGSLLLIGNTLFGMTLSGGIYPHLEQAGCIFSIDTNGTRYKKLLDFHGRNGFRGYGSLLYFGDKLYGMTAYGGTTYINPMHPGWGRIFSIDTDGTGYKDLLDFNGTNGGNPMGSLVLLGNLLYGENPDAGTSGSLFSIDTNGNLTNFCYFNDTDGNNLESTLTIFNHTIYGPAAQGGLDYYYGTLFKMRLDSTDVSSTNNITPIFGGINVYPNPSGGRFTIGISHPELVSGSQPRIEVYNILGKRVFDETLKQVQDNNSINLSSQPNGVYLYRVLDENGSLVGEGKLVIEK